MLNPRASTVGGSAVTSSPQPKIVANNFVMLERLGAGTYGSVFKARNRQTNQVVAIKCISRKSLSSRQSVDNVLVEIALLKKLRHPHIVELLDFSCDEQYVYIVMELCDGGDLSQFIRERRRLSERVVQRFLQQFASALEFLYKNHVVHADLKPSNILMTRGDPPRIKLADFGFAKHLAPQQNGEGHAEENDTVLRGSLLYMAPEVLRELRYSEKCDLWSVGVILYECLFGRAPYARATRDAVAQKVAAAAPIVLPVDVHLSDVCADCVSRLLQPDPDRRISMPEFLAHAFVDLSHAPSPHSWSSAMKRIADGCKLEAAKSFEKARVEYTEAVCYLLPLLHFESDATKRQEIRNALLTYMERAELLKLKSPSGLSKLLISSGSATAATAGAVSVTTKNSPPPLAPIPSPTLSQIKARPTTMDQNGTSVDSSAYSLLNLLRPPRPPKPLAVTDNTHCLDAQLIDLLAAFDDDQTHRSTLESVCHSLESAQRLVNNDELSIALVNYEQSLECLMHVLRSLNASSNGNCDCAHKKELLLTTINLYMSKAECVKQFLKQAAERNCEQQLAEQEREQLELAREALPESSSASVSFVRKCSVM